MERFRKNCSKMVRGFDYVLSSMFPSAAASAPHDLIASVPAMSRGEKLKDAAKKASELAKSKANTLYATCEPSSMKQWGQSASVASGLVWKASVSILNAIFTEESATHKVTWYFSLFFLLRFSSGSVSSIDFILFHTWSIVASYPSRTGSVLPDRFEMFLSVWSPKSPCYHFIWYFH